VSSDVVSDHVILPASTFYIYSNTRIPYIFQAKVNRKRHIPLTPGIVDSRYVLSSRSGAP
jgi:hypothetical protein